MSISSYYKNRDRLFAMQKAEREVLLAHGIAARDIDALHDEDYKAWKADRVYSLHNKTSSEELGEEAVSMLWLRRTSHDRCGESTSGFLDCIGNEKLLAVLSALFPGDLALVEACWVDGIPQGEYAESIGKSQPAIARKLGRIRERFAGALKK
jgi:hypothetical protein